MTNNNVKSKEAIVLATLSALVVQFTDLSGGYEQADLPWTIVLCISSISPWTISHLYSLLTSTTSSIQQRDRRYRGGDSSSQYRTSFILHDAVHNLTAFAYHIIPMPIFAWIALLNFPLWFGQLDLAISNKEQSLASGMMSSKRRPNKPNKHDPLLLFGMVVYSFGCLARGSSYMLSGSAFVPLAFPFTKRKFNSSVANNMIPLSVLFLLEHMTITSGMENMHNAVHTLSHYAIHKMVSDLYVNHAL